MGQLTFRRRFADPAQAITRPAHGMKTLAIEPKVDRVPTVSLLRGAKGTYRVEKEVASGGMGAVYLGRCTDSEAPVAIKIASNPDFEPFAERELDALTAVKHENVVGVVDEGVNQDRRFIVLEFLQGEDLWTYLENAKKTRGNTPVDTDAAVVIAIQVLAALEAVHEAGWVHADVKTANVFLRETEDTMSVKILDFGLSYTFAECACPPGVLGTPGFMSPEQATAHPFDHRTDIYATGALLYTMLTGSTPFSGKRDAVLALTAFYEPAPLETHRDDLPQELLDTVKKAMERNPDKRFRNAREFREKLEQVLLALEEAEENC